MGLLETDAKARGYATKKGIDVGDAVAVGRSFVKDHWLVMVVRPSVVEVHDTGKLGSFTRKGASVRSLAVGRIGSVSTCREGLSGVLVVEGSGQPGLEYRGDLDTVDRLAEGVRSVVAGTAAPAAAATPAAPAPVVPPPPAVPAGWYPAGGVQRYWDGSAWTGHTAPLG